jgi:phosphatidylserine/phosphatidylglycerophosphate/cardiolipin synthase-like enzyme
VGGRGGLIVADGTQAYIGSVNLSVASMTDARELGILVTDPTTIQMLTSTFEGDWAQAVSAIPATPNCPAVSQ